MIYNLGLSGNGWYISTQKGIDGTHGEYVGWGLPNGQPAMVAVGRNVRYGGHGSFSAPKASCFGLPSGYLT